MSANKASTKQTMMSAICEAIKSINDVQKGVSRAAIAKYLVTNCGFKAGALFNANLRLALKKSIDSGVLKQGSTSQRYKFAEKQTQKKKAKVTKKKKSIVIKKKKTAIPKAKIIKLQKENVALKKRNKALEKEFKGILKVTQKAVRKVIKKRNNNKKASSKKM